MFELRNKKIIFSLHILQVTKGLLGSYNSQERPVTVKEKGCSYTVGESDMFLCISRLQW